MFRKTTGDYNPKIDFKALFFLNPKLDREKNYNEIVAIFKQKKTYISEQGMWFARINSVFSYLLEHELLNRETFDFIARHLETGVDYKILNDILAGFSELSDSDITYQATWLLKIIMRQKPFSEYSDILAVIMFNAFLKKGGYIPIIFVRDYLDFIKKMIESGITVDSLRCLLEIYKDLSFKYEKKYKEFSKQDIIDTIMQNKNEIVQIYGVKAIWLYGSFVREEADAYSDIDLFIASDEDPITAEKLSEIKTYLESLLGRSVDMSIEYPSHKNATADILAEREVIFDDRQ